MKACLLNPRTEVQNRTKSIFRFQKFYSHSTWVENGHTEVADLLNLGEDFDVADNDTSTCDNTCTDDCTGNVITGQLTSGYFLHNNPPEGVDKCLHGSTVDMQQSGVNKDSSSKCFSPHFNRHAEAAKLAIDVS
jgi:hypothetical protein